MKDDFCSLIRDYPDIYTDRRKFKALLFDFFPTRKKECNAVLMAYDMRLYEKIREESIINQTKAFQYLKQLQQDYGLDQDTALVAIWLWTAAIGVVWDVDENELLKKSHESELEAIQEMERQRLERIKQRKNQQFQDLSRIPHFDFAALKEQSIAMRKKQPRWKGGTYFNFTTVVGLYYREEKDEIMQDMETDDEWSLEHEADNAYDSSAVAVYDRKHRKVGYLPKESNMIIANMLDAGQKFTVRLFAYENMGGGSRIAVEIFLI